MNNKKIEDLITKIKEIKALANEIWSDERVADVLNTGHGGVSLTICQECGAEVKYEGAWPEGDLTPYGHKGCKYAATEAERYIKYLIEAKDIDEALKELL